MLQREVITKPGSVVGADVLSVARFDSDESVGGVGEVVEAQDRAVRIGDVQSRAGWGVLKAAARDGEPVAAGGHIVEYRAGAGRAVGGRCGRMAKRSSTTAERR